MANLLDMAKTAVVGAPGMGAVTFGAAVAGYQTWAAAGAVSGDTYSYSISDVGNAWEIGQGVYNSAGYITRVTLIASSTNNFLNLTSAAVIWQAVLAQDLESDSGTVTQVSTGAGLTGGPITTFGTISVANAPPQNLIGNTNTVSATPTGVAMGFGLALSGGELSLGTIAEQSLLGNAATSAAAATTLVIGSGLSLSTAGTLSATAGGSQEWQAGTILAVTTSFAIIAETLGLGTIAASSIFANATTAGAVPVGVPVGAGLTFSAGTLEATGGSGTVTQIIAGQGLNGGTITASGTISLETIAASSLFGNAATAAGTMAAVAIGSGLSLSTAGTLSATGSGGVTSVVAGQGLNGGTITSSGTISLETIAATSLFGNYATAAGTMSAIAIGANLTLTTGGTLNASGGGGATAAANLATLNSGTISVGTTSTSAPSSFILGGTANTIDTSHTTAAFNVLMGGSSNVIGNANGAVIGGGQSNNNSSNYSVIGGGTLNSITSASYSAIIGGVNNTISAQYGMIGGGQNNIVSGEWGAVTGGLSNTAGGSGALAGGEGSSASGSGSVAQGLSITASASAAAAFGQYVTVSGPYSFAVGNATTDYGQKGAFVHGGLGGPNAGPPGLGYTNGTGQSMTATLFVETNGSVSARMTSDGSIASSTNVLNLPNYTSFLCQGSVTIWDYTNNGTLSSFELGPFIIQKIASNAATTIYGTTSATAAISIGGGLALQVNPTLTADTTNGGLNLSFTPPVSNTDSLYCVARLDILSVRL